MTQTSTTHDAHTPSGGPTYFDVPLDQVIQEARKNSNIRWMGDLAEKTPEWTRTLMYTDRFPVGVCGIRIEQINGHNCICSVAIQPDLYNTKTQMMGGAIFTLGDFATATADIMPHMSNTTIDGHIQYLAPTEGSTLYAHVTCNHYGHSVAYYNVEFITDENRHVAHGSYTYAHLQGRS